MLGVIGGTSLLQSQLFSGLKKVVVTASSQEGEVVLYRGDDVCFVQRHHTQPDGQYDPPHKVRYAAIALALKAEGCTSVVALASVGSLKSHISIGSLLVPDDYFSPWNLPSVWEDKRSHFVPAYDKHVRGQIIAALTAAELNPIVGGTYTQTMGPRFETKSEIRFLASMGEVVGMTGAAEATVIQEVGLPYACVCMVDNAAHGIAAQQLTLSGFYDAVKQNQDFAEIAMRAIVDRIAYNRISAPAASSIEKPLLQPVDTVIDAHWVLPVIPHNSELENHSVVIHDGRIVEVLPHADARAKFSAADHRVLTHHIVMPGFINAHTHSPMTLLRGLANDLPLIEWLQKGVWPAEAKCVSPEFCYTGTKLAAAEMLLSGTTSFLDMYFFPEDSAKAMNEVGIRAVVGLPVLEFPTAWAANADEYIDKGLAVADSFGEHDRISFALAPHAPYTVSDKSLSRIATEAEKRNMLVTIHLHETAEEVTSSTAGDGPNKHLSDSKCSPLQNLNRLGLLNDRMVAAHCVHMDDADIETFKNAKSSIAHCPVSNMKLACGLAPVQRLIDEGVNVALGTDGCSSNNTLDMIGEMKTAALMGKIVSKRADSLNAHETIRMATIRGADALHIHAGALEPGRLADVIALRIDDVFSVPMHDAAAHVVYSASRQSVNHVWVQGEHIVEDGFLRTANVEQLVRDGFEWKDRISQALAQE